MYQATCRFHWTNLSAIEAQPAAAPSIPVSTHGSLFIALNPWSGHLCGALLGSKLKRHRQRSNHPQ